MTIHSDNAIFNKVFNEIKQALNAVITLRDSADANNALKVDGEGRAYTSSIIVDKTTLTPVQVTASGQLKVSTPPPSPPPNTTAVADGQTAIVPKNGGTVQSIYKITNGKTLTIQNFRGGGMTQEGKIVLEYDPNNGTDPIELIATGYIGGDNNFNFDLNNEYIGDATNQIIIYAQNDDNHSNHEMSFYWTGYEQ